MYRVHVYLVHKASKIPPPQFYKFVLMADNFSLNDDIKVNEIMSFYLVSSLVSKNDCSFLIISKNLVCRMHSLTAYLHHQ